MNYCSWDCKVLYDPTWMHLLQEAGEPRAHRNTSPVRYAPAIDVHLKIQGKVQAWASAVSPLLFSNFQIVLLSEWEDIAEFARVRHFGRQDLASNIFVSIHVAPKVTPFPLSALAFWRDIACKENRRKPCASEQMHAQNPKQNNPTNVA